MAFVKAAGVSEIPAGAITEVELGGKAVAIANVNGKLFAINNICLHRGGPLGQGELEGSVVTCPWHGWQFDVTSGKACANPDSGVATYPIEVRGDDIFVDID